MSRDIVTRFIELLAELQPGFSDEAALQIEKQIRHEYGGGDAGYVAKTSSDQEKRKHQALREVEQGALVSEAAEKHGVGRQSIYRLLRNRSGKK